MASPTTRITSIFIKTHQQVNLNLFHTMLIIPLALTGLILIGLPGTLTLGQVVRIDL